MVCTGHVGGGGVSVVVVYAWLQIVLVRSGGFQCTRKCTYSPVGRYFFKRNLLSGCVCENEVWCREVWFV